MDDQAIIIWNLRGIQFSAEDLTKFEIQTLCRIYEFSLPAKF